MVILRWLSSRFLISKRNIQVHQKDILALAIHSSCLKALSDRGCLRLYEVLKREFKVKSPPWLPPPSQPSTCLRGMLSLANGPKTWINDRCHVKNLTWQTKGRHDQWTDSPRARLTEGTTLSRHGGPFPTHGGLAWELSLTMRPTRTASPPMFFLTAVTRNLAIARFLCEYSGPFWGMFLKIRLHIHILYSRTIRFKAQSLWGRVKINI